MIGRGALILRWSRIVKFCGAVSSENAGISNLKTGENPVGRKSKVSRATVIVPGLVGPKPRRISVGDGHQVNIPELVVVVSSSRRTSESGFMVYPSNQLGNKLGVKVTPRGDDSRAGADKKSWLTYATANRTANQHRCSSRVDSDLRENLR